MKGRVSLGDNWLKVTEGLHQWHQSSSVSMAPMHQGYQCMGGMNTATHQWYLCIDVVPTLEQSQQEGRF